MSSSDSEKSRLLLVYTCTFAGIAVGVLGLRFLWAPVGPAAVAVVLACALGFLSVPVVVRLTGRIDLGGLITVGFGFAMVTTVGYLIGGLDAPMLVLAPLVPLVATFLLGPRAGFATVAGLVAVFAVFAHLHLDAEALGGSPLSEGDKLAGRALMLGAATVLCFWVAWYYERHVTRLRRTLEDQATRDSLTRVANRRSFTERLEGECRRAARSGDWISLLIVDIDHFKRYNDAFGHQRGDECLVAVAQAAERRLRRSGELLARYGGEEFAAVLPHVPPQAAMSVAEDIRRVIERLAIPHPRSPHGVVTVSVGVASIAGDRALSPDLLISRADKALYRAKAHGRNRTAPGDLDLAPTVDASA